MKRTSVMAFYGGKSGPVGLGPMGKWLHLIFLNYLKLVGYVKVLKQVNICVPEAGTLTK